MQHTVMSNAMYDPAQNLTSEYEKSSLNADTVPTLGFELVAKADLKTYVAFVIVQRRCCMHMCTHSLHVMSPPVCMLEHNLASLQLQPVCHTPAVAYVLTMSSLLTSCYSCLDNACNCNDMHMS